MTKAELVRRQYEEMNAMIEECMDEVIERLPMMSSYDELRENGLTLDEVYNISNKFLSKGSLAYYLSNYNNGIGSCMRDEVIKFAEVDDNGRIVRNGRTRNFKISKVVYGHWEEEEE